MTPREVVLAYNLELCNKQRYELADEIIADQVIRLRIGSVKTLTRKESLHWPVLTGSNWVHIWFSCLLLNLCCLERVYRPRTIFLFFKKEINHIRFFLGRQRNQNFSSFISRKRFSAVHNSVVVDHQDIPI